MDFLELINALWFISFLKKRLTKAWEPKAISSQMAYLRRRVTKHT